MIVIGHASHLTGRPADGSVDVDGIELAYRLRPGETHDEAADRTVAAYTSGASGVPVLMVTSGRN